MFVILESYEIDSKINYMQKQVFECKTQYEKATRKVKDR